MDDVEFEDEPVELLDVRPRWTPPRWLVRLAVAAGGAGVVAATVTTLLSASSGSGGPHTRQLPPAPTNQVQLYEPLRGHHFL